MQADISVLVVDDEPLARQLILELLEHEATIARIQEATNAATAIDICRRQKIDIMFLDIQMPEQDGFTVPETLGPANMPATVFVTAFDQYAVRAFDQEAVDYILKPLDDERLLQAYQRALTVVQRKENTNRLEKLVAMMTALDRGPALLAPTPPTETTVDQFRVKAGSRVHFIPATDVQWLQSAGNYIELHTAEHVYLLRGSLKDIETRLSSDFMRVHRSTMVNRAHVKNMRSIGHAEWEVTMAKGHHVKISRSYKEAAQQLMAC